MPPTAQPTTPVAGESSPANMMEYEWEMQMPAELDGVEVHKVTLILYHRSINVLTSGYVNGLGGFFFDLPHYELVQ